MYNVPLKNIFYRDFWLRVDHNRFIVNWRNAEVGLLVEWEDHIAFLSTTIGNRNFERTDTLKDVLRDIEAMLVSQAQSHG